MVHKPYLAEKAALYEKKPGVLRSNEHAAFWAMVTDRLTQEARDVPNGVNGITEEIVLKSVRRAHVWFELPGDGCVSTPRPLLGVRFFRFIANCVVLGRGNRSASIR
jgi:hypothetical protein